MDVDLMHIAKDGLLVIGRIITLFPLLLVITLFMGRRSIGELPIFDFLVIISLGAVVGADIADPKIEHIHTGIAVIVIALVQRIFSALLVRSALFGKFVSFEPVVVIKDGAFLVRNMNKLKYPIDNILQMLRELDIFDISQVDTAVIEANGKLTAYKKPDRLPVTRQDMGIPPGPSEMAYPVVIESCVQHEVLKKLNVDELWLIQQLNRQGVRLADVFFASVNDKLEVNITDKTNQPSEPPVYH